MLIFGYILFGSAFLGFSALAVYFRAPFLYEWGVLKPRFKSGDLLMLPETVVKVKIVDVQENVYIYAFFDDQAGQFPWNQAESVSTMDIIFRKVKEKKSHLRIVK